jgi:hypothetical protein
VRTNALWLQAYKGSLFPTRHNEEWKYWDLEADLVGHLAWDRIGMVERQPESLLSWVTV